MLVLEIIGGLIAYLWDVGEGGACGKGDTRAFTAPLGMVMPPCIGGPTIEVDDGKAGVETVVVF